MRGLQVVQFGLFLILMGFSVILFADVLIVVGVASLFTIDGPDVGAETAVFSFKVIGWGIGAIVLGVLAGGLGKLLCVGAPEETARNLMVASILCDFAIGGTRFAQVTDKIPWMVAIVCIWILSLVSYITFLKFLTRMGDNVGEPRVGEYVAIIYGGIGGGFIIPMLFFISWKVAVIAICLVSFITTFVYNYTIYTLFRALPLYIDEVRMGLTDPKESGAERKEKERKARSRGPGSGVSGPSLSKPLEEPKGTPPEGSKLYRIPKTLQPLHHAVKEGDRNKVEMCLAQGHDYSEPVKHGLTPLHIAASVGVMDVADALIKAGAKVDSTCEAGLTPLYFAIQTGNPNIVGMLIDKGASLYHRNIEGFTPLHWACSAPHPNFVGPTRLKMVNLLISQGADLNALTDAGKSARDLALENQLEEVVGGIDRHMPAVGAVQSSFQQRPGQASDTDASHETAAFKPFLGTHLSTMPKDLPELHAAVKEGEPEKIKRLVIQGADMTETIEGGIAPIHITAITGVMSGTDLLLSLGSSANDTCDFGLTPIFLAVHVNNVNMVGYLISRGGNPNHQDELGRTPLHWAAAAPNDRLMGQNRLKMVEFLLQHGADPKMRDLDGLSPADLGRAAGHDDILKLFGEEDDTGGGSSRGEEDDYYV